MGKSLIKHKVMCIFPLQFKNAKVPNKSLETLAGALKPLQLVCIQYLKFFCHLYLYIVTTFLLLL